MNLIIEKDNDITEMQVTVSYSEECDEEADYLIKYLEQFSVPIIATKDGEIHKIPIRKIYYIDCVDNRTYLYMNNQIYETMLKLYQLEEQLDNSSFVRIGKSTICNINFLKAVKPLFNGRYEIELISNEKLIVNRSYVGKFKEKFGI